MIERPQFKAHFDVETVKGEGVFLLSEIGRSVLNGRLYETVSSLIDGHRSTDDIVQELQGQVSAAEVYYALAQLEQKGYLTDSDQSAGVNERAFWSIQDIAPQTAARFLAKTKVAVTSIGEVEAGPFLTLLQSVQVGVGADGKFGVVLTDDYLRTELRAYNNDALRKERPWILIKPAGSQILVGPVFHPGQAACWECLAQRMRANRSVEMFLQRKQKRDDVFPVPRAGTAATQQVAYGVAATEIAKWIVRSQNFRPESQVLS